MHQFELSYQGALRCVITHLASGTTLDTDAPVDNRGKGERFSPTDLTSVSLAACICTEIGALAEKKGLDIRGTKVNIAKEMNPNPRKIAAIRIRIKMPSNLGIQEEEKAVYERLVKACAVGRSLHPDIVQDVQFEW